MEEVGPILRERILRQPPRVQKLYLRDALQECRLIKAIATQNALRTLSQAELDLFRTRLSCFLVFTAREWFQSIPQIQYASEFTQTQLRLMLSELICTKKLIDTDAWNLSIVRSSLIYWCGSHVPLAATTAAHVEKIGIPLTPPFGVASFEKCAYCRNSEPCMALDRSKCGKHRRGYICHNESGLHLCHAHALGMLVPLPGTPTQFNRTLKLHDGREVYTLLRSSWADDNGLDVGPDTIEKRVLIQNEFDEYDFTFERKHDTGAVLEQQQLPDNKRRCMDNDELFDSLRDRHIQRRLSTAAHTFWLHALPRAFEETTADDTQTAISDEDDDEDSLSSSSAVSATSLPE